MTRRQEVLTDVTAAREEARLRRDTLSFFERGQLYDLEAELDMLEHRLLAGRERVTDSLLARAESLATSLRAVVGQRAA